MKNQALYCVALASMFLVVPVMAFATITTVEECTDFRQEADMLYCIHADLTEELVTSLEPIIVTAPGYSPSEPDFIARLIFPEFTVIRYAQHTDEWMVWRLSQGSWSTVFDPSIKVTVDPTLSNGYFHSNNDGQYRVYAITQMSQVTWSAEVLSGGGSLTFSPTNATPSYVTFSPSPAPNGRDSKLSYRVKATTQAQTSATKTFTQDDVAQLQQEYIDLNRTRWANGITPTIPGRSDFRRNYRTTNYSNFDYARGRQLILMYMGSVAEGIRSREIAIVGDTRAPRVTSGYRNPRTSAGNSLHQFGYAIDMNPSRAFSNQDSVRNKMLERIQSNEGLGTVHYDSMIHGPIIHIHIERQSVGAQGGTPGI